MPLLIFSNGYDNEYYIREMCHHLPFSHGTVQTIPVRLEEKRVPILHPQNMVRSGSPE